MARGRLWHTWPALLALALFPVAHPAAQEGEGGGPPAEEGSDEDKDKKDDDEKDAKYFAIVGGDVYAGTGAVLRGATVLARNGKIQSIGYDLFLPEGTETLDAQGLRVYPGLIALAASSRITAGSLAAEVPGQGSEMEPENEMRFDALLPVPVRLTADGAVLAPDLQSEGEGGGEQKSEVEDTFDPFSSYLVLALASGITSVQQQSAAVKLKRYEIDDVLLGDKHLTTLTWSVNNPTGIASLRTKFAQAARYLRDLRAWRERAAKDEKEPSKRGVDTGALRILSAETLAYFRASGREDILGIARFAQEYGFRPVIEGCEEGWTVADELGRAGAYAILVPRSRGPKDEHFLRPGGASIENAAILHKSGVQVAVHPENTGIDTIGIAGRDVLHIPIEAGFAVRGGLSDQAALEAMTIVPARVLGVDHRVGTLEVGKDCDAILTDGDLLHYQTFVQYTVVDGKLVYDKEKELYYAHIRPRPKKPVPEAAAPAPEEEKPEGEKTKDEAADEEKKDEAKDEDEGGEKEEKKDEGEKKEEGGGGGR